LSEAEVATTFTGVRSLLASDVAWPSARSREHRVVRHGRNLLSIVGGKYTTYRAIAQQTVDAALKILNVTAPPCCTTEVPLPSRRPAPAGEKISNSPAVCVSDIAHACEQEMAITLGDVMRRRTQLALSPAGGPEIALRVARVMAPLLGWSPDEERAQFDRYAEEWNRNLS
jgi:glycerol-3-phosphate dehydrogenase